MDGGRGGGGGGWGEGRRGGDGGWGAIAVRAVGHGEMTGQREEKAAI